MMMAIDLFVGECGPLRSSSGGGGGVIRLFNIARLGRHA